MIKTLQVSFPQEAEVFCIYQEAFQHLSNREQIYHYCNSNGENWLQVGYTVCDVIGYVILPDTFPDYIDLPDDNPEDDEL